MSAYYAAPEDVPSAVTEQEQLAPVLVAFAGPGPQSRMTVAFRLFLAIPQFIVLWALAIAAYVITIVGWFAALFTGRLPAFAADFLTGFLRWQTRVFGYTILLTDEYPPFALEDADYPIRVAVRPGRLNRLAVLLRFFLLIPAWIVQAVVAYGALTVVQFVSWLIVLISGQMPYTLYQALAAVLRYQARVFGFACMLTSAYPGGLYGDLRTVGTPGFQAGYGAAAAGEYGAPAAGEYGATAAGEYGAPAAGEYGATAAGEYGAPAAGEYGARASDGYGATAAEAAMAPWLLILSAGAKRLMTGFVILGVLLIVGQSALEVVATSKVVTAAQASNQLQTDIVPVTSALNNYSANATACGNSLPCVTGLDRRVAATLDTFAERVRDIAMPSDQASTASSALAASTSHLASIFSNLGGATSASQYLSIARASGLEQVVEQMNQAYINLANALPGS
jgi:hypothetical protein